MAPALIPCAHCGCHAKSTETLCPSCGEALRHADGSAQRTAVAVLLGLTAAGVLGASCSSSASDPHPLPAYGISITTSSTSGTGGAGTGGAGTGGGSTDGGGGG
jgi:hypothetical protein